MDSKARIQLAHDTKRGLDIYAAALGIKRYKLIETICKDWLNKQPEINYNEIVKTP